MAKLVLNFLSVEVEKFIEAEWMAFGEEEESQIQKAEAVFEVDVILLLHPAINKPVR